jgi:hypothetical protein
MQPLDPAIAERQLSRDCVEKVARGSECSVSWKTSIDGSDSS